MPGNAKKIALYCSYQLGKNLPGYVLFALKHLAETEFHVVLLTNQRELSDATYEFLADNDIELFLTQNRGFDFGMWRRYLQLQSNTGKATPNSDTPFNAIERLLLINDSIVYFQDNFKEFFRRAEESEADVVSLCSNTQFAPHLQSFFLYMKPAAFGAFYLHLFETREQENFYDAIRFLEVGLSEKFMEGDVHMESLFHTERDILFSYPEIIEQGAGFVKRKLLQRRFTRKEKIHFIRQGAFNALNMDYATIVKQAGLAPDFKEEWLPTRVSSKIRYKIDLLWENAYRKAAWPALRKAIKLKYKLLRKPLNGDEFK